MIVTRGYGTGQLIATRGYGTAAIIQVLTDVKAKWVFVREKQPRAFKTDKILRTHEREEV